MQKIKQALPVVHPTDIKLTKEELIKFQLRWILKDKIELNDTQLSTLAYVYLYKYEAPSKMVADNIGKSEKSIENIISIFRKTGLIEGLRSNTRLNPNIKPVLADINFTVKLRL